MENLTPMMQQYMTLKSQYKDSIMFFRLGDFYEMFFDDAMTASRELEITLTQRDCGMDEKAPMCGVPHHVADIYISRLVSKGYKVAIAEQVEDPATAKGIVKRDVTRVVTPGTITDMNLLDEKSHNYLMAIYLDSLGVGVSYVDNSTGHIFTCEFAGTSLEDNYRFALEEIGKIMPKEILANNIFMADKKKISFIENRIGPYLNFYEDYIGEDRESENLIKRHFKVDSLSQLDIEGKKYASLSTTKLLQYLYDTQKNSLEHINDLRYYEAEKYMIIDMNSRINLEIFETILTKQKKGSLLHIIDKTATAMGGRLLKKWLEEPLLDKERIDSRLNMVEYFYKNIIPMDDLVDILKEVYDIERLVGKISNYTANGRDLLALKKSIGIIPRLKEILLLTNQDDLMDIGSKIDQLTDIYDLLDRAILEETPITIREGGLIKDGYNEDLDELRLAGSKGKEWISSLEAKEKERTGIKNLKIGYNRLAGYFIEVTKSNISSVPDRFIRKQTLTNSERYYTSELKDMESTILGAMEKSILLEYNLFLEIRDKIKGQIRRLQASSRHIAKIDVIISFAKSAHANNFSRPEFNDAGKIDIIDGRHPVVEKLVDNNLFVANDSHIDLEKNMIQIITGPNMAGKSTYMRQVALIVVLAHIGSFVPADKASISITDRIFTRIGAADNLSQGESTFMVEMTEVSNIVNEASKDSLIILDEVGRGTSTYDGLSIAWALIEYLSSHIGAKTLFATHYHELTQLEDKFDNIKNLTISVKEMGKEIVFLRKIIEGSTNKSYGIQVARLAGINDRIIDRANEILSIIEGSHEIVIKDKKPKKNQQVNLMDFKKDYFIDKIVNINIDEMTPLEALTTLNFLIKDAENIKEN